MNKAKVAVNINRVLDSFPNFLWPLRIYIIRRTLNRVGKGVSISRTAYFENVFSVNIGNDVFINRNFYCSVVKNLVIKDRVMIGPNCTIFGGDHDYSRTDSCMRFCKSLGDNRNIVIEQDAWIGSGTLMLKKSIIGEGAIVGANSLVNSKLLPYCVYVGQPAHFVKPRFNTFDDLCSHLEVMRKKYGHETIYSKEFLRNLYRENAQVESDKIIKS